MLHLETSIRFLGIAEDSDVEDVITSHSSTTSECYWAAMQLILLQLKTDKIFIVSIWVTMLPQSHRMHRQRHKAITQNLH